ncbi:MAG: site-specific DNA-methyltransferase, partial [Candidatus Methanofastidiosa archaeon]|nr:site-specific DNA-methyltransferase [Candidatus Methanofastidiosa archaeon]
WKGKADALRLAQTPSTGTLRPCKEESKHWDTTENLYIEGDNLEVLKLLQKSYYGKIKMIYIDPPYNTGKEFVYPDDYKDNLQNYLEMTGQISSDGTKYSTNTDAGGRYHTNWLNMMYPRLRLSRNLLTQDGVIFISIDDNEFDNLKKICNEIFGEENFIATIVWERAYAPINLKKHFSVSHDYILCYTKSINHAICFGLPRNEDANQRYKNPDNDPRGVWKSDNLSVGPIIEDNVFAITTPSGRKVMPPHGYCWRYSKDRFSKLVEDNRIWFGENGNNVPSIKRFLSEVKNCITPMTVWKYTEVGHSQEAKQKLKRLFNNSSYFDYPKSIELIKRMLDLYTDNYSIILDFFSGSATTAHAVMESNAKDNGNRKFIMIQLQEPTSENSEAFKAGFYNISDIGKERIRLAGDKILSEINRDGQISLDSEQKAQNNLDIGFKVFKLDSSNLAKWDPEYDKIEQTLLDSVENLIPGRNELDLIYEIMLKYGIDITLPIEDYQVNNGKIIYSIGFGALMMCLNDNLDASIATEIIKLKEKLSPEIMRVVFKDNGFKTDSDKTNIKETLKTHGID